MQTYLNYELYHIPKLLHRYPLGIVKQNSRNINLQVAFLARIGTCSICGVFMIFHSQNFNLETEIFGKIAVAKNLRVWCLNRFFLKKHRSIIRMEM